MFDPFPTFPLPPCNAFGGPPMEPTEDELRAEAEQQRAEDLREYERDRYVGVLHALADHAADERRRNFEDAHHKGDPAPVIGWAL